MCELTVLLLKFLMGVLREIYVPGNTICTEHQILMQC